MRAATAQQQRFAHEYLVDLNATRAAIRAGYSEKHASSLGYQLLQKPPVQALIQSLADKRSARTTITSDTILSELLLLARSDVREAFDENGTLKSISKIPEHVARAISGIEFTTNGTTKIRFWPKVQALELLGKHLKIFTEVPEHRIDGIYRAEFADGQPVHSPAPADLPN